MKLLCSFIQILEHVSMEMPDLRFALENDILNGDGQMLEPISGKTLSLADAIGRNLIVEVLITYDDIPRVTRLSETYRLRVESVLDTVTNHWLRLDDAMESGIISRATGEFIDGRSGACVPLELALENERVKGKLLEVVRKKEEISLQDVDEGLDVGLTLIEGQVDLSQATRLTKSYLVDPIAVPKTVCLRGVIDPVTGAEISVMEAIELGLIDPSTKQFIDQQTGEKIPLDRAIAMGLVVADVDRSVTENFTQQTFTIGAVRDPATGELVHPSLAVARGLLDMARGVYLDPLSGEAISLAEAMEQGLIQAEPLNGQDETLELVLKTAVTTAVQQGRTVFKIKFVRDPSTGEMLHPEEAVNRGLLDTERGLFMDPLTGTPMLLHEAYEAGLIDADEMERLPESSDMVSVSSSQDLKTRTIIGVVDPRTNKQLSVAEALSCNLLDDSLCQFTDPRNGQQMSLGTAIDKGFVIIDNCDVLHSASEQQKIKSYRIKSVFDPQTGEEIPIADAIQHNIVDKTKGVYRNRKTNEIIPIDEAIRRGLIVTEPLGEASLKASMIEIDGESYVIGKIRDPRTGQEFDAVEAERRGLINKRQRVYIDPATGENIPLLEAMERGLLVSRPMEDLNNAELADDAYGTLETSHAININKVHSVMDPVTGKQVRLY
jgi:Plectin repeat